MNKETLAIQRAPFFIVVLIGFLLLSCKGQEDNYEQQNEGISQDLTQENTRQVEQISQVVRVMFQDSKGIIWFGTQNGAFKLIDSVLVHIDGIKSEYGQGVTIKDITEANDGTIWFGHTDGLSSLNGEGVTNYYKSDGLLSNDVWCIEVAKNGHLWIGTIEGICVFDGQKFVDVALAEGKIDSTLGISSTKMVHHIFEDKNGVLWFSSNAGLFSYSNNELTPISSTVGIQSPFVNLVYEDKSGAKWISTKEGLYLLKEQRIAENITAGKMEIGKGIGSVAEDKDGKIWFVANQHSIYIFDGKELTAFQKPVANTALVVFQIYKDQDDRLWFVGYGGAYRLENEVLVNITKNGPW